METNFLSAKAEIRYCATGWGSYASEPITAGETVAAFGGSCVSRSALDALSPNDRAHAIQIDEDLFMVSPVTTAPGETISHSCAPNCGISAGVLVVAMRYIAAGEQLSYDHAMSSGSDFYDFECRCATPSCRHKVTGSDWMIPELQIAYRGYFSPYLGKRIASLVRTGAERRAFAF